jgi:hypothetical protein
MPHDFVREPDRNEYGRLKLLRQTTGKFVIYDPDAKIMGQGITFKSEEDAHMAISAMTGIPVHDKPVDSNEIREWMDHQPHTPEYRCRTCR